MYRTIIIQDSYTEILKNIQNRINELKEDGSIFAIFHNEYCENGDIAHDVLELANEILNIGLNYVNIIVYPSKCDNNNLTDNVKYILWFCKNPQLMFFDKNTIREKSIWKDVEWGKREKNYNPLGKDPTNVWIPTKDDGNANITEHIIMSDEEIIDRLLKMTSSFNDSCIVNNKQTNNCVEISTNKLSERTYNEITERVYFATSENMDSIENGSSQLVITSPPYWDLKDYFKKGQIGQESFDEYLGRIKKVFEQCYIKLNETGTFCLNINIRVKKGRVFLIPFYFVNICKDLGFHYKGIVIWHKSSGIPTSDRNLSDHYEFVLIFSKEEQLWVNQENYYFNDYKNSSLANSFFWNINRKAGSVGKKYIHPAIYPNELSGRAIKLFSNKGDMIIDPFLGSGTTLISSIECERSCTGYEYYEGFEELIKERVKKDTNNKQKVEYVKNSQ